MTYKESHVYIMTNKNHTVLYVGSTTDLQERMWDHCNGTYPKSFTKKFNVNKLVYVRDFDNVNQAVTFERLLKKWKREWKEHLINKHNPAWHNLIDVYEWDMGR